LEGFVGVFEGLFGVLVGGLVIFFAVMDGGGAVGVGGEFVKFGGADVRLFGHRVSVPRFLSPTIGSFRFPGCPIADTCGAAQADAEKFKGARLGSRPLQIKARRAGLKTGSYITAGAKTHV
jgi:hypothetical protein